MNRLIPGDFYKAEFSTKQKVETKFKTRDEMEPNEPFQAFPSR